MGKGSGNGVERSQPSVRLINIRSAWAASARCAVDSSCRVMSTIAQVVRYYTSTILVRKSQERNRWFSPACSARILILHHNGSVGSLGPVAKDMSLWASRRIDEGNRSGSLRWGIDSVY
jgi:hypothetical protein